MGQRHWFCLLSLILGASHVLAATDSGDAAALTALADDWQKKPTNWIGSDPCGDGWVGIKCRGNRVVSVELSSLGLKGTLSGDIGVLTELQILDLSYNLGLNGPLPQAIVRLTKLSNLILVGCRFSGQIPDISSLKELVFLSLNSNQFTGEIPRSIGSLTKLYWFDISDNMLTGTLPISDGKTLGLDNLKKAKHFHFGNNKLSGSIPAQLFSSDMTLIHVLFENNSLSGNIPSSLGLVKDLEVLRLDRNSLTGPVPSNIYNLTSVEELYLSNNKLVGALPNLTGMNVLHYVDLSNNSFDPSDFPPWLSMLKSPTTVVLERLRIGGEIPAVFFNAPQLQTVRLMNNKFNGTLNITTYSSQLQLVDLRNNQIEYVVEGETYDRNLMLSGNPYCQQKRGLEIEQCRTQQQAKPSYETTINCANKCPDNQDLSPSCHCTYPYQGVLYFRALSFSDLTNASRYHRLEKKLKSTFISNQISVDSVSLYNLSWDLVNYLRMNLKVFPYGDKNFNETEVSFIGFILSNQTFKPPKEFGTFVFAGVPYRNFQDTRDTSKSSNLPLIIGVSVAGVVLALIIIFLAIFAIKKKRKADNVVERRQPSSWDSTMGSGSIPQLNGTRLFTPNELKHITDNFSDYNVVGSGSYGKVYKGILPTGQMIAIKRVQQGSMQGGYQFKTEIETLTRVHHKNLVKLIGFCFNQGILVYEYIPNGSLWDSLSGKSGIHLDWRKRLWIAIGIARGLSYLHELADPPIIHRDVKSSNILLDQQLNAKVSDFGLSKFVGDGDHITTQVKGTMGYVDPEYYMTEQLTEKSDVYGFGVLMLELITGRKPIEQGRYIVREMKLKINRLESLYGLHNLLDSALHPLSSLGGLEKYVDVAMQCVEEAGVDRPTMGEVVKEIEGILQLVGMNPNTDSDSSSYEKTTSDLPLLHPYNDEPIAGYNSSLPTPR